MTHGALVGPTGQRNTGSGFLLLRYAKPSSFLCSLQSAGRRGVRRIRRLAVSSSGLRPARMAAAISGARKARRSSE